MTIAALTALYLARYPVASAQRNVAALYLVLRDAFQAADPATLDCSAITESASIRYFTARERRARAILDQSRRASMMRSTNSIFNQARSVFAPRALARMPKGLPDFSGFVNAGRKFGLRAPVLSHPPADPALIRRTLVSWRQLPDLNMFFAAGHALACGLRAGEIAQARWSWHTARNGSPLLHATAVHVKNQTGELAVVPLHPFWRAMRRRVPPAAQPADYIITGTDTERTDSVFRRVSDWLRDLGWTTQKTNHALRDLSASLVTMKYGLDVAKHWCRHATIATTERHYNRFVDPVSLLQNQQNLKWLHFAI